MTAGEVEGEQAFESPVLLENEGRIKSIHLPAGWREVWFADGPDSSVLRTERIFRPATDNASEIVFFLSGRRLVESDSRQFFETLGRSTHVLADEELSALVLVLADLSEPESFELTEARTRELADQTVLEVRGLWLYDERSYHGVLFPSEATGQIVQQIYLLSPAEPFPLVDKLFEEALASIQWR